MPPKNEGEPMTVDQLIDFLMEIRNDYGNLEVWTLQVGWNAPLTPSTFQVCPFHMRTITAVYNDDGSKTVLNSFPNPDRLVIYGL